ncbi:MAG: leucine-rich repeat domain-containing protein [archaeon]|nr:leucine-rich repeat domain-containing protein [archaeon]
MGKKLLPDESHLQSEEKKILDELDNKRKNEYKRDLIRRYEGRGMDLLFGYVVQQGRVKKLNFYNEKIGEINGIESSLEKIAKLSCLKRLDLSNNKLKSIPDYSNLSSLEHLNLSRNELLEFPDFIKNLKLLEFLDLSENKINKLPDLKFFEDLPKLKAIYLNDNKFGEIPEFLKEKHL